MKKILIFACLFGLFLAPTAISAQTKLKLGYIDSNELLLAMPGRDSAKTILEKYAKELETQIRSMSAELEQKYQDYMNNQANYTDLIKKTKEKELQDLQTRVQDFQTSAQEDLQKKEQDLLAPIIDKAKKAIDDVAKENGYTYIFDAGAGFLLFYEGGENIMPLVKKKLGL
ncbi:MAG: OmpH family outer membrane protein [Bacteroidetes bacterium]|nr:OmpH family outer membrane protein [Bacteroidota bacterium]MBU1718628.1 OmpH family outer membrane protein [Bacteroidota bacterium]